MLWLREMQTSRMEDTNRASSNCFWGQQDKGTTCESNKASNRDMTYFWRQKVASKAFHQPERPALGNWAHPWLVFGKAMPAANSDDETQALAWPKAARAIERNATILKAAPWMMMANCVFQEMR